MIAWLKEAPLAKMPRRAQWLILLFLSVVLMGLLAWFHLPAALLLGAMFAGILVETGGGEIRVPAVLYGFSQAVIGCMIARVITPQILSSFMLRWPLFLGVMVAVIIASCVLGYLLTRLKVFPNTTAIWGLLPGAASVMMIMADEFGADGRLVAFMQYLRVVLVAIAAAIIGRFSIHPALPVAPVLWFSTVHWAAFGETLVFIVLSMVLGKKVGIPAGAILVPLILGAGLEISGGLTIELPRWFLAISYALLGWNIGLRFSRKILAHAARTLPQTILSVVLLMAFCAAVAGLLVKFAGIDLLTAYLATSPGGLDAAAIIAASTKVDFPFVMSMQAARLLMVLLIGPVLSRYVAGWAGRGALPETPLQ